MQNNSLATAKRSARLARYWRPIGKLAATSAVLVGAVAWTSTLSTPLRHRTSDEPTVVRHSNERIVTLPMDGADYEKLARIAGKNGSTVTRLLAEIVASWMKYR